MILPSISKPGTVDILVNYVSTGQLNCFSSFKLFGWRFYFTAYSTITICHTDYHRWAQPQSASRMLKLFTNSSAWNPPFSPALSDVTSCSQYHPPNEIQQFIFTSLIFFSLATGSMKAIGYIQTALWREKPRPQACCLRCSPCSELVTCGDDWCINNAQLFA